MSNFPIYYPWSIWQKMLAMRSARESLCMLDVQLGSACNANCPRCDSSCCDLSEPADLDIEAVSMLAAEICEHTERLKRKHVSLSQSRPQGFICGLGEPTVGQNLEKLKELIRRTKDYGFIWSMFTNGLYWDDELDEFLNSGNLAVIVQYNSMRPELIAETLGVSQEQAKKHLANREHLLDWAWKSILKRQTVPGCTHVAASTVPDRDNYGELPDIVDDSVSHNVFPSLGELEKAGKSKGKYYDTHCLTTEEMKDVLNNINISYGIQYARSICPAAIGAIHIDNHNLVTVDKFTGLSCGWFNMSDPQMEVIGDIRKMGYGKTMKELLGYRESRIPHVRKRLKDYPEAVFGGCGGPGKILLTEYTDLYN